MNRRKTIQTICKCGAPVLRGIDADTCGLNQTVDPTPLTKTGTLLAILDQRHTYHLDPHQRLTRRHTWNLNKHDPPVLADHRCHQPIPTHWHDHTPPPARHHTPEEVPF